MVLLPNIPPLGVAVKSFRVPIFGCRFSDRNSPLGGRKEEEWMAEMQRSSQDGRSAKSSSSSSSSAGVLPVSVSDPTGSQIVPAD